MWTRTNGSSRPISIEDPVTPGSLGLESFLQLLKFAAVERWGWQEGNILDGSRPGDDGTAGSTAGRSSRPTGW